ncbi:acylphosphatase, partial [Candidatus Bathyarchaeota archaeon]|nr:acylphosphatase [Candidatus Bathyarchaeota archaeon]
EGEKDAVDDILDFCRRGPPGAIVKDVEVQWAPWTGEFQGFRIIY